MYSVKEANNLTCDYHRQNLIVIHFIPNVWGTECALQGAKGRKCSVTHLGTLDRYCLDFQQRFYTSLVSSQFLSKVPK